MATAVSVQGEAASSRPDRALLLASIVIVVGVFATTLAQTGVLARSGVAKGADLAKAAQIALELHGKPGTAMASFARLSDVELAAVITHTRNSWGNKTGEAIQPSEIKAAR